MELEGFSEALDFSAEKDGDTVRRTTRAMMAAWVRRQNLAVTPADGGTMTNDFMMANRYAARNGSSMFKVRGRWRSGEA